MLRAIVKSMIPGAVITKAREINRDVMMQYGMTSYSQEGEDILLRKVFSGKNGFYVDVGAYHPVAISNSYLFYRVGWHGIVIEPFPGTATLFKRKRPRDIMVEMGVAAAPGALPLYIFTDRTHNTFSEAERDAAIGDGHKLVETTKVAVDRLENILDRHLPAGQSIDFMTIDVEGYEQDVIETNDWSRYRPKMLCVEMLGVRAEQVSGHGLTALLGRFGYRFSAKLDNSVFFQSNDFSGLCSDKKRH